MNPPDLHPAYFNVHFRGPWPDRAHPDEFAIITAYATTGETWTEAQNQAADIKLEHELREAGSWMRPLTGYDPKTSHAEPGWAAEISFEAACDLGLRFRQDAIFWVSGDELWVAKCSADRTPINVGPFLDRLDLESPREPLEREPPGRQHKT